MRQAFRANQQCCTAAKNCAKNQSLPAGWGFIAARAWVITALRDGMHKTAEKLPLPHKCTAGRAL
jgi:hypothetical protein